MMKQLTILSLMLLLTVLFSVGFLTTPQKVEAGVVSIEGIKYDVNFSLEDNLKLFVGKRVSVTLDSGKTFVGIVKEVGNHLMWLEKLEGKEFFDALIRINSITAIDTRFRDLKP
ncbi:MAG: hypothetical protein QG578_1261 [Thermodesulfobacteriota bacterium]|nr:hypothetical protein [Thermodesulfobacteriota bacterium]